MLDFVLVISLYIAAPFFHCGPGFRFTLLPLHLHAGFCSGYPFYTLPLSSTVAQDLWYPFHLYIVPTLTSNLCPNICI